jgi:hypothetical protein
MRVLDPVVGGCAAALVAGLCACSSPPGSGGSSGPPTSSTASAAVQSQATVATPAPAGPTATAIITSGTATSARANPTAPQPASALVTGMSGYFKLGARYVLTLLHPGLLRSSTNSDGSSLGNPHLCNAHTSASDRQHCGA